jgi:hypothetical protein
MDPFNEVNERLGLEHHLGVGNAHYRDDQNVEAEHAERANIKSKF